MKNILLPIIAFLLACSPGNEYQPMLDAYFSKSDGYVPGDFEIKDTMTLDEFRKQELKMLRVYQPDDTTTLKRIARHTQGYIDIHANGGLSDFEYSEKLKMLKAERMKSYAQLRAIDSLEALIGGFDKDHIKDMRGIYRFKIGTDTFNYLVIFDSQKNIISADKR